ncbi:HDOD domain-containing protein [Aliiglaciecola sp. 3_MG-2023]|uniref:HDOD domain-containing protein n=1 Tax=Aliiglaciecola sp. 3_MG-2023 TaxID=3062644 RepID=UPI0026E2F201|nr:HDOD domain-containing protein [Aliiglaciecola sp. 3_MG-2023]MDO6695251.1 HDOD domain-containing protein [Aliiglaciecola sp. 3_MG-2023]
MFEKLISKLFKRTAPKPKLKPTTSPSLASKPLAKGVPAVTSAKPEPGESSKQTSLAEANVSDIPLPAKSIKISVTSFNRLEFLFYDYLLGPSATTTTLNPLEQYILTRVNHALKSPQDVLTHFPVLPQSVLTLTNLLNDPDFNLTEFIKVIEQEPSIASELMKKANSPAYKRGDNEITDLQKAFMLMGAKDIKEFVLNGFVKKLCHQKPVYFKAFGEKVWLHSQEVAVLAKSLAKARNLNADAAYIIGLMHDLGKIVIFQFMVEAFQKSHPDFKQDSLVFKKFLSQRSMLLSVELMKIWEMPSLIIDVVKDQTISITNISELSPLSATLFEANLMSEISLTFQAGDYDEVALEEMLAEALLSDQAKDLLRHNLDISPSVET